MSDNVNTEREEKLIRIIEELFTILLIYRGLIKNIESSFVVFNGQAEKIFPNLMQSEEIIKILNEEFGKDFRIEGKKETNAE